MVFQKSNQIDEAKAFIEEYSELFDFIAKKIESIELKDAIAHLLNLAVVDWD